LEFITVKMRARPEEVRPLLREAVKRGHDGGRMVQFADGKNGNFAGVGLDQFDRADGSRGIVRVNIHQDDFGPDVLYLAQHRVRGAARKAHVTEDVTAHSGHLQTMLEHRQPFSVFGQKSYRYTLHWHHSVSCFSMLLR
jgi:hypothetical protein